MQRFILKNSQKMHFQQENNTSELIQSLKQPLFHIIIENLMAIESVYSVYFFCSLDTQREVTKLLPANHPHL